MGLDTTEKGLLKVIEQASAGDVGQFKFLKHKTLDEQFTERTSVDSWLACLEYNYWSGRSLDLIQEAWNSLEKQGYVSGELDDVFGQCTITSRGRQLLQDGSVIYLEERRRTA